MSLKTKTSTKLNVKKVIIYTLLGGGALSILVYIGLTFFGVIVNPKEAFALDIAKYSWDAEIIIDNTKVSGSNDLEDFPVLLEITDVNLKHVSLGGKVENKMGYDVVFADEKNKQLDHEVVDYDPTVGKYVAWVKVPALYATVDTKIKMFYGGASITKDPSDSKGVFNSNYESVWHMDNDPSSSDLEDAVNNNDAKDYGGMDANDLVSGKIGMAIDFDGKNDYLAIEGKRYKKKGAIKHLTVTGWLKTTFNHTTYSKNWSMLDFDRSEYFNVYVHGDGRAAFSTRGSGEKASSTGIDDFFAGNQGQLNDGDWHHIAAVYDGTNKYLYIDGALAGTKNNPHLGAKLGTGATRYGFIGDGSEASSVNGKRNNIYYEGQYDEIRFSETAFSPDWIATEYTNQSSPTTFATVVFSSVALPVELASFDVKRIEEGAEITWITETEINNDYFTVEKSTDGVNYIGLDEVVGAGNSNARLNYSYIDDVVESGVIYYRLKQTDFDGKFEYFPPKSINNEEETSSSLSIRTIKPNPFTDQFTMEIVSEDYSIANLVITNINGKQEYSSQINIDEGITEYIYQEGSSLPSGIYVVNLIREGQETVTSKIVKR